MTTVSRISLWIPVYLDIEKHPDDIEQDDVEEAFSAEYGDGPTVELYLDFFPDWEIVDEWNMP
jgi:hypothetical protein